MYCACKVRGTLPAGIRILFPVVGIVPRGKQRPVLHACCDRGFDCPRCVNISPSGITGLRVSHDLVEYADWMGIWLYACVDALSARKVEKGYGAKGTGRREA